jgi:hypothetical protein
MMAADGKNALEPVEARQEAREDIPAETTQDASAAFGAGAVVEADEMRVLFGFGEDSPEARAVENGEATAQEADEARVVTPYTSTVAHPKDITVLVAEEDLPPALPEFDGEETAAKALSASLNTMIGELLEVEIKEPKGPDHISPDESGFPPRTSDAYRRKIQIDADAVVLEFVAAASFFVCGLNIGLWTSYFFM